MAREWKNAGEDYVPGDIGVPGFEVADEAFLAEVLAGAKQAAEEKRNAKQITEMIFESIKIGKNLFL